MKIWQEAELLSSELIEFRRDIHKHPEAGWTEFRTTTKIAAVLQELGFEIYMGNDIIAEDAMMGMPSEEELSDAMFRAEFEGADPSMLEKMQGGKTGVVGILHVAKPGKTVAFRFDIDCNEAVENDSEAHRPCREEFGSIHCGLMHACGHDGHVAIGIGLAKLLANHRDEIGGTVKLIFQPAEEGVRGAKAMVAAGVVDDVDYFFSGHVGFKALEENSLVCLTEGFLATTKLDAVFRGCAAHAGAAPESGRNALLAAASASLALHAIPRHSEGASRINVGVLEAGTGRNVVADRALMKLETRGATAKINNFMTEEAKRILKASALMYNVEVEITETGSAPSCTPDYELGGEIKALAAEKCGYDKLVDSKDIGCSEDCSYFMERVQELGGRAAYMQFGTPIAAGHHNDCFDFDETCLFKAAALLTEIAICYSNK